MTEGIIQQVFRQYIEHSAQLFQAELYNKATKKMLFEIQQELIEKIKQEYPDLHLFMHVYNSRTVRQKLIGDNNQ